MTIEARENATPAHGWMTRATERTPAGGEIQPKRGGQLGIPVNTQRKNVSATDQWIRRDERRWRTISLPTITFSRSRATMTAESRGRRGAAVLILASWVSGCAMRPEGSRSG